MSGLLKSISGIDITSILNAVEQAFVVGRFCCLLDMRGVRPIDSREAAERPVDPNSKANYDHPNQVMEPSPFTLQNL